MKKLLTLAAAGAALLGTASAAPAVSFIIDGDTFSDPFSITNTSTDGEQIVRFFIDLDGTGVVFDTVGGNGVPNDTAGVPFGAANGTGSAVGLIDGVVTDGGTTLDITFNDFDAGETFDFDIDVDQASGPATVFGDELIGATAFVDFDNGLRIIGTFMAIDGNPDASGFMVTQIIDTPAVPLPAGAVLLLTGLGGLAAARRKA